MFKAIHDSEVVAYSVDSRAQQLVLVFAPGHGDAVNEFKVVFESVAAHQFMYPQIPSIVLDLVETPIEKLLLREWDNLLEGSRQSGWPGPWFESSDHPIDYCISSGLRGFEIEQSYGMDGWIIARSVNYVDGS